MKNGTCPKCGSKSVYHEQNGIYIPKMLGGAFVRTDTGNMGSNTDDYICTGCGYIERYLDDMEKLKAVAKASESKPGNFGINRQAYIDVQSQRS